MLATMEGVEILNEAEQLAAILAHSDVAEQYRAAKQKLQEDKEAQKMIAEFRDLKERYEEVQRFGKYHPDYTSVSTNVRILKRNIDLLNSVAVFKKAEKELESLLNELSAILAGHVSENIKVPTGNPFFDKSCGGGCGSGGSCGCG